jgi:hypothetical protein
MTQDVEDIENQNDDSEGYILNEQQVSFNVPGLKPDTQHYFYFDGVDKSADCAPESGKIGDSLFSDENGELVFTFFYKSSIVATTDVKEELADNDNVAGVKKIVIVNSDESSRAESTISFAPVDTSTSSLIKTTDNDVVLSS